MFTNGKLVTIPLVVIIFIVVCSQVHFANAELHPNTSYVIYEQGYDIKNTGYTLDLQIQTGSSNSDKIPVYLVEGLVVHDGKYFVTSENWKGIIMKSDNLMMLSGRAVGTNGTVISITLLGKQISDTQNGAIYRLAGNIKYDNQRTGFTNVVEIENVQLLTSEKIAKEMPHKVINQNIEIKKLVQIPKKANAITLITKHYERFYLQYPYSFTSKVYYSKDNPHDNFDQHGGEVKDARIIADIINQDGDVVKSFEGMTDKFGYFSDSFLPPDNFEIGTYAVVVTAEKNGKSDIDELVFHIFKRPIGGKPASTSSIITMQPEDVAPETTTPETTTPETTTPETTTPETTTPETTTPETTTPETTTPETTTPPKISISSPVDGSVLRSSSLIISGTATGTNLASVTIMIDGIVKTTSGTNNWSINFGPLSDGSHTVTATVIDGVGKTSNYAIHVITDGTKPTGRILSIADGQTVHTPTLQISGTTFDAISGIKKVEIQIDSNAFQIASGTTAWTFDTTSLSDGTHNAKIRVTDNAGNIFTGLAITFTIRTTPTGLTAITLDENKIGLIWTSQILETGSITGYKIERESPIGGGWHVIVPNTGNVLSEYTDTGLTAGTVYNYRVYTIFADHTSPPSNSASATTNIITLLSP